MTRKELEKGYIEYVNMILDDSNPVKLEEHEEVLHELLGARWLFSILERRVDEEIGNDMFVSPDETVTETRVYGNDHIEIIKGKEE